MRKSRRHITPKQRRFVDEYLVDLNATAAAIRAGYSPRSAKNAAYETLQRADISDLITAAKRARSERTKIDADWLLLRLADEADADLADLYNAEGGLRPVSEWPPIWRKGLVAGIDTEQRWTYVDGNKVPDGVIVKVKLSDRAKRLELIGRHVTVGAFKDEAPQLPGTINLVINRPAGDGG
jgi:phage terminase small subunit